jgi:phosphoribosylformylglycinamidine synthase
VSGAAEKHLLASCHDVSDGGLAVALAESSIAGGIGFRAHADLDHRALFSESPGRVVVSCRAESADAVLALAKTCGLASAVVAEVGGASLDFGSFAVTLTDAKDCYETALPEALSATMTS